MVARLSDWFGANRESPRPRSESLRETWNAASLEERDDGLKLKDGTNLSMKDRQRANLDGSGS